jgi:cobaltochelatase CobN
MHLLAAQPGAVQDGSEAVDLGQSPGDIVLLTAADTEIASFAAAQARLRAAYGDAWPSLRLANLLHLGHNMSVDLYVEQVVGHAKLVVGRLLGGRGYWPYGVDEVTAACADRGIALAWLPGDDQPDPELAQLSRLPAPDLHRLWQYCVHGGVDNAEQFLRRVADLVGHPADWREPAPLLRAGLYWPGLPQPDLAAVQAQWQADRPVAAIVFYRALLQAGNLAAIDALIAALRAVGLNALPIHAASLKDPVAAATAERFIIETTPAVILNATGFALSNPTAAYDAAVIATPFDGADCPILQVVLSGSSEAAWRANSQGLAARDIAMNVALPEVDGRLLSRAVAFKGRARRDPDTQADIVVHEPVADRVDFVAALAANWSRLRALQPKDRRVAIVLANYPSKDGRLGNGVGLDTPAGTVTLLHALADAGYAVADVPADGDALVRTLSAGPTNAGTTNREIRETLSCATYESFFRALPEELQRAVSERWGAPNADPFFLADHDALALPAIRLGGVALAVQPARGYHIDPVATYHDPALVPPHGYLAFHAWLRAAPADGGFGAHAVIHMGKHGNLEWLPGKALALSAACWPEAALGPLPHLYPFIVNDPGEGSQAKRRAQAVIVDHLTPPLTRAESYGPLRDLEQLVDEYFEASGLDPRRLAVLARQILELSQSLGLDKDAGIAPGASETDALQALDGYLCELKELQIRDGLHVFGRSPTGEQLTDLLVALTRVPRAGGKPGDASLIRALADDLGLDLDPLDCVLASAWTGPRPTALAKADAQPWRTNGDTVERLELLAQALVAERVHVDPAWARTRAVLDEIETRLRPAVAACGDREIAGVLTGLAGRFLAPGPSGAPTRGRPEVLPTGRNFYSVDLRTVPTPAAWQLGWASAGRLIARHAQEHGNYPRRLALSAWGTANMRTGGDDIAQALALMGVRPTWDAASRRVTGFEVLPLSVLGRPRVDVTLRVSGFFRDAFPNLIDLVDSAARAVAALDEPEADNPLAAAVAEERDALVAGGADSAVAERQAGFRVFGSQPGAYGAGLQALIDSGAWDDAGDLARAYLAWGVYAYGSGAGGEAAQALFARRLGRVEAVVHNQDNREHDLLDSDDYYQFEGGLTAAVQELSGERPAVYHMDHSRPESPRARTLEEEIARVVRARVLNPKWIRGVMRHGYKGAFEMAATVDYLFAFAATSGAVADHHFDAVYDAYLGDPDVRDFVAQHNPAALAEMAQRLLEAQERGLWRPRSNAAHDALSALARPAHAAGQRRPAGSTMAAEQIGDRGEQPMTSHSAAARGR